MRFGGGYMLNDDRSAGSLHLPVARRRPDADGRISAPPACTASTPTIRAFALDVGLRRYGRCRRRARLRRRHDRPRVRRQDRRDAGGAGGQLARDATDFYDQTAAFTLGGNVGVLFERARGIFAQLGLRYVTGMSEVDDFEGTGLETINDKSSRWTLPFVAGVRLRFVNTVAVVRPAVQAPSEFL